MPNTRMIEEISKAIYAHGAWKLQLRAAITRSNAKVSPDSIARDDKCEFGKWLDGPSISPKMRTSMPYQLVRRLHAEFHACAARVLTSALDHNAREADILLAGECSDRSQVLIVALTKWKSDLDKLDAA